MKQLHGLSPKLIAVAAVGMAFRSLVLLEQGVHTMVAFRQLVGPSKELNNALVVDAYPLLYPGVVWGLIAGVTWWAFLALRASYRQKNER